MVKQRPMPDPHQWGSGCRGKMRYKTRRAALAAMRVMVQKDRATDTRGLHPYRCPACKYWHLGNHTPISPSPLKKIRASANDEVEITWKHSDGREDKTRHRAPEKEKAAS